MSNALSYLLLPLMSALLISAQSIWGIEVKAGILNGNAQTVVLNLLTSWKMWLGALIYVLATLVYFILLTKLRFFSVQVAMTGVSILLSVAVAYAIFGERPSLLNGMGILLVFCGLVLVLQK